MSYPGGAFDRLALWVNSTANLGRLPKIAAFGNGNVSDVFLPGNSSLADMDRVRATVRPTQRCFGDVANLRAHIWEFPKDGESAKVFATRIHNDILRCKPGTVELDLETDSQFIADTISYLRNGVDGTWKHPSFLFRINVAPFHAWSLPIPAIQSDPALYVCQQTYYGDMSPVAPDECLRDLIDYGVPKDKATVTYAGQYNIDGVRRFGVPTITYNGNFSGRYLEKGLIFSDDLLSDAGRL